VQALLAGAAEIDWQALRRAVTPKFVTSGEAPDFNLEGVTVWRESQEPWRVVKRLIVLGFAQGHYPRALPRTRCSRPRTSRRSARRWAAGDVAGGPELEAPAQPLRRQLGAVTDEVTFLVPRRDPVGEAQAPSESLVFMHQLFDGPRIGRRADRSSSTPRTSARRWRHLALAAPAARRRHGRSWWRTSSSDAISSALRVDGREAQARVAEQPRDADGLAARVAAAALEAEPLEWAPEHADPLVLGTLAHAVFEGCSSPARRYRRRSEIPAGWRRSSRRRSRRIAPFLRGPQWQVERRNFIGADDQGGARLARCARAARGRGARRGGVAAGQWSGIPVHGQTDLILGLPGERLLVVDYKRSKSRKRVEQMQKGFDSQASLYRAMIETGGPKHRGRTRRSRRVSRPRGRSGSSTTC
jgi:ATP-dependent helicase/nuclease subunit B